MERELGTAYRKGTHVIIPFGNYLGFVGSTGKEVVLGLNGSDQFTISIDGATALALASDSSVTTLSATVASNTASITTNATAIATVDGKLSASYALTLDVNGRIASMKLLSDGTTSSVKFRADTFQVFNGTSDEAPFVVEGGVVKAKKVQAATLSAISADLGSITAGEIDLTAGSYVRRDGAGFGVSSDLVLWYGLSSIARASATKTNGVFALATDGKVYYGSAELSAPVKVTIGGAINVIGSSGFTGNITVTATGGVAPYTYRWSKEPYEAGQSSALTNTTTDTVTVTATLSTGQDSTGRVRCDVTDSLGATASITQGYNFSKTS